ncbi:MAG: type II/IV secretion system protein, partial [Candidatus Hydrogenedentes bacterium]|nr:type II/IV secretion system protein [Candidatus Hydrogenedentota bacterium]
VVSTPAEIAAATKRYYGIGADTVEQMISEAVATGTIDLDSPTSEVLDDTMVDASIVKFVNELLYEAISSDATDIHIEPFENELRVRNRIDGILHQASVPPNIKEFHHSIVSRIKILANLNIAEHRLPQDGKIEATLGGENYDLRVSILPTPHGETVNIRILSRQSMFLSLNDLGLAGDQYNLFETLITRPHGVILVTGPTGSGKTTTLYAALQKINNAERKIITIEDPIEYQLSGITQMQVLEKIGFTFARGLRSMLRHDPDIMMVGEIRDFETAEVAIRCSLTGHLVFSTLHTNDAASAVTRLIDMGVEPFLLASSIVATIAQRLVRLVCPVCKTEYEPDDEALREMGVTRQDAAGHKFYRGVGCEACRFTGYKGRTAIYEILPFTEPIRRLAMNRQPSSVIKQTAIDNGMRTLRQDGWLRIIEGKTTFEEVLRVAQAEEGLGFTDGKDLNHAAV